MTIIVSTGPEIRTFPAPRKLLQARSKFPETAPKNFQSGLILESVFDEDLPEAFARCPNSFYEGQSSFWRGEVGEPDGRGASLRDVLHT